MIVSLNGATRELPSGATVTEALALLACPPRGIAVAVNEQVVPASRWSATPLRDEDRVEVLTAAQGG